VRELVLRFSGGSAAVTANAGGGTVASDEQTVSEVLTIRDIEVRLKK